MQAKMNCLAIAVILLLSAVDCVLGLASPGCGKAATLASGNHTITVNGKPRAFVVRLPEDYNLSKQYRLIFEFHWAHGSAGQIVNGGYAPSYYGLPPLDKNNSVIYIVPEGLDEGGYQGWANKNGQDVDFTDAMLNTVQNGLCIDKNLVFSMGHSYGAGMSYALACARPNVFRAVAINSGALISGCSSGTSPVAMYIQHGLGDTTLPISAGRAIRDQFVKNNGCAPLPTELQPPKGGHLDIVYQGCAANYPLIWVPYDGGHVPAPKDAGASISFTPGNNWDFFLQFS
ncbi:Alpha/Beta hydrolase protein [Bisporella sp. PMI_857]|nr:Alpha/Beta hydrolase protein [Bisporella sp. PMI_857]